MSRNSRSRCSGSPSVFALLGDRRRPGYRARGPSLRRSGAVVAAVASVLTVGDHGGLRRHARLSLRSRRSGWRRPRRLALAARRRPGEPLLLGSVLVAVGTCAFTLVATAPPEALAYGAANGWWALVAARDRGSLRGRRGLVRPRPPGVAAAIPAALLVALLRAVSVLVVTALTPDGSHTTQGRAGGALGRLDALGASPLLAAGVMRASTLGVVLRRSAIRAHRHRGGQGAAARHGALRQRPTVPESSSPWA